MIRFVVIALALIVASPKAETKPKNPPKNVSRPIVLMPVKNRDFVPPEQVGVGKDCPFPTVRTPIKFCCPQCGLRMQTHVVYPHLPWCPKDGSVMLEK